MPVEAKPLVRPDVLRPHLAAFQLPDCVAAIRPKLAHWTTLLSSSKSDTLKERELLPDFLTDVFGQLLGYTGPADGGEQYTMSRERHVEVDGKFADAVLGNFAEGKAHFVVALEGKGPRDPLDRPFAGRKMSAVDQGYRYAINLECHWIIVTSMRQTRLYHKGSDQHTYERFDTGRLAADEAILKKFVFLLGAERVVPADGRCHLHELLSMSEKVGRQLTKEFYVQYADIRHVSYERLCSENPTVARHEVLACTQKMLDRVLFCAFCEDRGLLPAETIRHAHEHRDPYNPKSVWENFRGLFRSINLGNAELKIPAYNGGLFADDPLLDRLAVPNDVCDLIRELGEYDYRPAHEVAAVAESDAGSSLIDVEILGHIFEQSITDLERLRNEIDGLAEPVSLEKHRSRRKKEGAFYTPAFITRYIVEQALGGTLRDRFKRLREGHAADAKGAAAAALKDPNVYELEKLKKAERAALVRFWEAWQDELRAVRLLDPACGSGAFLIEAFDQLYEAVQASNDRLEELRGHRTLFDLGRHILQHNLFGVDLNDEAIDICRLSLWIKTAEKGKTLTSLDHTIRVGNSVVADPAVHPKAFDWHAAFPEVFSPDARSGGFDVIVGNPPYIRQEWLAAYKPYWERTFESYDGVADIFTYFYELAVRLLRSGGRIGFITSGSWVRGNFGAPLRAFLAKNAAIESMVDFGEFQPFEDAEMIRPSITILKKQPPGGRMHLFKWLTSGHPPENLSEVITAAPTMRTDHLGADAWELDPDDVIALRKKLAACGKTLDQYTVGKIQRGVLTGLTEAFVIDRGTRDKLIADDPRSTEVLKPFAQGTHLRPWHMEETGEFILAIKSGGDFVWPWSDEGDNAEKVFGRTYPAVYEHLNKYRDKAIKREDQGKFWWELRSCAYWQTFDVKKIVWPDISKLPRFSLDTQPHCLGNTAYTIPLEDYFLLGVLSSWATWFFISKTAQPLRLRGDRWQYRLFAQYMEHVPIPDAGEADRRAIADLAETCGRLGTEQYELQTAVQRRLAKTFGEDAQGRSTGSLNTKAQSWWELPFTELGTALKTSFALKSSPFKNPKTADEWEPYLAEKRSTVDHLSRQLADSEVEINDRVFRLFQLTPDEIKLLQREVEH